jgi:hypothetical protein
VLQEVVDQVLPRLEALAREGPEKGARTNLVRLYQVVIDQALVHILDRLKD